MTNKQFVATLIDAATKYNTIYVRGGIGAPLNSSNRNYYAYDYYPEYNGIDPNQYWILNSPNDTFTFDCIGLVRAVAFGWCGNKNALYGGAVYSDKVYPIDSNEPDNILDIGTERILKYCYNISTDFDINKMIPGEELYMPGHAGVYIGNGLSVECTGSYAYGHKVVVTSCNRDISGYKRRNWTSHGKLKWIDYTERVMPESFYTTIAQYANKNLYTDVKGKYGNSGELSTGVNLDTLSSDIINFDASNIGIAYTGSIKFRKAESISSKEFFKELDFSVNTSDTPYIYLPQEMVANIPQEDIYGMLGMIVNTSEGINRHFIVAGIEGEGPVSKEAPIGSTIILPKSSNSDDIPVYTNLIELQISDRLMYELKYQDTEDTLWISDNDDNYTILLCLDPTDWDKDKPLRDQIVSEGQRKFGYYSIMKSISGDATFNQEAIDTTKLYPYVVSIDRNTSITDYQKLIDFGVVGVIIEAGELFDSSYAKAGNYNNPNLVQQMEMANKYNLPFGFYVTTRASSVEMSNFELSKLSTLLLEFAPKLGLWVKLGFRKNQDKKLNDRILDNYKKFLTSVDIGFKDSIGIYTDDKGLETITWNKHYKNWYLWLERKVGDAEDIQKLLTPELFDVNTPSSLFKF